MKLPTRFLSQINSLGLIGHTYTKKTPRNRCLFFGRVEKISDKNRATHHMQYRTRKDLDSIRLVVNKGAADLHTNPFDELAVLSPVYAQF